MDSRGKTSGQNKSHEKRALSRLKAFVPCRVGSGQEVHDGHLVEVSLAGAAVTSTHVPQKGDPLTLTVDLPGQQKSVSLVGHVVRVTTYIPSTQGGQACRFAVRFNRVTPDSILLVQNVMSRKIPGDVVGRGK